MKNLIRITVIFVFFSTTLFGCSSDIGSGGSSNYEPVERYSKENLDYHHEEFLRQEKNQRDYEHAQNSLREPQKFQGE